MATRPNIIVITTHDTGRHFGCYGVETVHTPAIDALAEDGCRFTNYFAAVPLCSPSRGAMMTGRYPQSNGLMGLTHSPWHWRLNAEERHLSHILSDAGYHTALFGLQHEATDVKTLGFQAQYADQRPTGGRCTADEVAQATVEFLKAEAKNQRPFYAQVGFFETHRVFDFGGVGSDDSKGVYVPPFLVENEAVVKDLADYQGAIRKADEAVGIITKGLAESGLAEETILVFTVDHGIPYPRAKGYVYDPGLTIALIVRWPGGGIQGKQTCDRLLSNVDFLPTLLNLIDVPVPENVQGVSFAGAFGREETQLPRDAIFAVMQSNELRCIRTERHKLIRNFVPRRLFATPVDVSVSVSSRWPATAYLVTSEECPAVQLFDLEKDPNEFQNVAEEAGYAKVRTELDDRLWAWLEEVGDPILEGLVPTPYYSRAMAEYAARSGVSS